MTPRPHARKTAAQGSYRSPEGAALKDEGSDEAGRLCLIGLKVDLELRREIDAYAEAHGITAPAPQGTISRSAAMFSASAMAFLPAGPTNCWRP
jgi:hypothetical protein